MKVAVFSAKRYDREFLNAANASAGPRAAAPGWRHKRLASQTSMPSATTANKRCAMWMATSASNGR